MARPKKKIDDVPEESTKPIEEKVEGGSEDTNTTESRVAQLEKVVKILSRRVAVLEEKQPTIQRGVTSADILGI